MGVLILCSAVLLASSVTGNVQAYLDPGTGSMAIQAVLAGIVGGLAAVKIYWTRIRSLFGKAPQEKKSLLD
jgi:membrane associated rhomboid family serine protease